MSNRKSVWLLGAGFSRPLGGPLFSSVFPPAAAEIVKLVFNDRKYDEITGNSGREFRTLFAYQIEKTKVLSIETGFYLRQVREMGLAAQDRAFLAAHV